MTTEERSVPPVESSAKGPPTKSIALVVLVALAVGGAILMRTSREEAPAAAIATEAETSARLPTLVELGSDRCTSCRAMIPVLDELRNQHSCSLQVQFIDVWDNPTEGERFGVRVIPTQVLLDPEGREIMRHTGFWSADAIRDALAANGYPLASGQSEAQLCGS